VTLGVEFSWSESTSMALKFHVLETTLGGSRCNHGISNRVSESSCV